MLAQFVTIGQMGSQTRVSSSVVDAKTMESLSFAHVVFKTEGGTITNEVGHFELNCLSDDTLVVSYLGYFPKVLVVSDIKMNQKFYSTQIPNSLKTLWFMPTMTISTNGCCSAGTN